MATGRSSDGRIDVNRIDVDGSGLSNLTGDDSTPLLQTGPLPGRATGDGSRLRASASSSPRTDATALSASMGWTPYSSGTRLYVVNVDGTRRRLLARSGAGPEWSPDGRWISFTSNDMIELTHPDGSGLRTLTP
jgi:Tol biopolymer transport system component